MSMNFGLNLFGQTPYTSNVTAGNNAALSSTDADLKEYKSLLDKKSKGMLTSRDQSRLRELQSSLSKAGKLNNDGSIKTRLNSDKLKANARRMSWEEVAGNCNSGVTGRAASILQKTAARALAQQNRVSGGMMSKNGSIFGRR